MGMINKGFDDQVKKAARLTYAYNDALKIWCGLMAQFLLDEAINETPVDTGNLVKAWKKKPLVVDNEKVSQTVYNRTDYGPSVEYGHRIIDKNDVVHGYKEGQYFFTRAQVSLKRASREMLKDMAEYVRKEVNR